MLTGKPQQVSISPTRSSAFFDASCLQLSDNSFFTAPLLAYGLTRKFVQNIEIKIIADTAIKLRQRPCYFISTSWSNQKQI